MKNTKSRLINYSNLIHRGIKNINNKSLTEAVNLIEKKILKEKKIFFVEMVVQLQYQIIT